MKRFPSIILIASLVLGSACASDVTEPERAIVQLGDVRIERTSGATRLTNQGTVGLAYALWNPQFLGLMAVCAEVNSTCLRLAPGASIDVPDSEIVGSSETSTDPYTVRIWSVYTNESGATVAGDVLSINVRR